jgi:cytoskeletal protein CcmA (bactofilin family)
MKSGASQVPAPTDLRTLLGEGTTLTGEVKFVEVMKVDCRVSGKISSDDGSLIVSENGEVQADIDAGFVEVIGLVEGRIKAKYKIDIRPGGRVYGDIFTPVLTIENGAVFDGKCNMIDENQKGAGKITQVVNS